MIAANQTIALKYGFGSAYESNRQQIMFLRQGGYPNLRSPLEILVGYLGKTTNPTRGDHACAKLAVNSDSASKIRVKNRLTGRKRSQIFNGSI